MKNVLGKWVTKATTNYSLFSLQSSGVSRALLLLRFIFINILFSNYMNCRNVNIFVHVLNLCSFVNNFTADGHPLSKQWRPNFSIFSFSFDFHLKTKFFFLQKSLKFFKNSHNAGVFLFIFSSNSNFSSVSFSKSFYEKETNALLIIPHFSLM